MRLQTIFVILVLLGLVASAEAAPAPEITRQYNGIDLIAMPLPPQGKYDIDLIEPASALAAIEQAIELIYAKSPFSVQAFERLKKAGKITVVYDPEFPKEKFSSVIIAAFFPDFFQKQGPLKEFMVVVGRYGAKWPIDKLAAVIVHELGGHGYQHLRGRSQKDRKIDRECEAQLYEEAALQDFNVIRSSSDMIRFRHEMHTNWCSDFRRYMRERDPKLMDYWNYGKPDVPKVLNIFEDYLVHLRELGVSGKAVAATNKKRLADLLQLSEKAKQSRSGPDLYAVAVRHFNGMGTPKNLIEAYQWFLLSAETGYPPAQHATGVFLESGLAGTSDIQAAYIWYYLAANKGIEKAQDRLNTLSSKMSQADKTEATSLAKAWKPKGK